MRSILPVLVMLAMVVPLVLVLVNWACSEAAAAAPDPTSSPTPSTAPADLAPYPTPRPVLKEINPPTSPPPDHTVAIVGATLINGLGGPPLADSVVIVKGEKITTVGPRASTTIPAGAEIVDAKGLTLLPGLIDAHFHIESDVELPRLFLSHGVTAMRDPGEWLRRWTPALERPEPMPRYFHCGPHLERNPPKHPGSSYLVKDVPEAIAAVNRWLDEGASAIKIYNRVTLEQIKAVARTAHAHGVPVICHLEIVRADDAVKAGADGIEHTSSFGPALNDPEKAARFAAFAETGADYQTLLKHPDKVRWGDIDLPTSQRAKEVIQTLLQYHTTVCPTLAVYEPKPGEPYTKGFQNFIDFTRMMHKAGVTIVVGSHDWAPRAQRGAAYLREVELLVDAGLTPMDVIQAATINNARYFHSEARLGSVEAGKLADLLLIDGDPLKNISAIAQVRKVMLNGQWVKAEAYTK